MMTYYDYHSIEAERARRAARHDGLATAVIAIVYFALVAGAFGAFLFAVVKLAKWAWYF